MEIIVLYLVLLAAAFFVLVVRPQRRQMAARRALIESLQVGDEVITAGGIYGIIRAMDKGTFRVEVADGVALRLAREAITARPVSPPVDAPADETPADATPADATPDDEIGA